MQKVIDIVSNRKSLHHPSLHQALSNGKGKGGRGCLIGNDLFFLSSIISFYNKLVLPMSADPRKDRPNGSVLRESMWVPGYLPECPGMAGQAEQSTLPQLTLWICDTAHPRCPSKSSYACLSAIGSKDGGKLSQIILLKLDVGKHSSR